MTNVHFNLQISLHPIITREESWVVPIWTIGGILTLAIILKILHLAAQHKDRTIITLSYAHCSIGWVDFPDCKIGNCL